MLSTCNLVSGNNQRRLVNGINCIFIMFIEHKIMTYEVHRTGCAWKTPFHISDYILYTIIWFYILYVRMVYSVDS